MGRFDKRLKLPHPQLTPSQNFTLFFPWLLYHSLLLLGFYILKTTFSGFFVQTYQVIWVFPIRFTLGFCVLLRYDVSWSFFPSCPQLFYFLHSLDQNERSGRGSAVAILQVRSIRERNRGQVARASSLGIFNEGPGREAGMVRSTSLQEVKIKVDSTDGLEPVSKLKLWALCAL